MTVIVTFRIRIGTILQLKEIRLGKVDAPSGQQFGVFFFVSLTSYYIDVVLANRTIVCKDIFNQCIRIVA